MSLGNSRRVVRFANHELVGPRCARGTLTRPRQPVAVFQIAVDVQRQAVGGVPRGRQVVPSSRQDVVTARRPLASVAAAEPHLKVSSVVDHRYTVTGLAVSSVRQVDVRLPIDNVREVHPQRQSITWTHHIQ